MLKASLRAALAAALSFSLGCAPSLTPPSVNQPRETRATPVAIATAAAPSPSVALPEATAVPGAPARDCSGRAAAPEPTGTALHTIRVFDIGQGDSELIQTASGKTVLIDSGDRDHSAVLLAQLAAAGVTRLDLLVATHPHLDHIGGMEAVIEKLPVRLYVDPGTDHPTETYRNLLLAVQKKKIPYSVLRAGKTLNLGTEGSLTVLSPPADHLINTQRSPENANSLVIRLTLGSFKALFTGDAEPETLDALAAQVGKVDYLKIAHHGSRYGTNAEFLDALEPHVVTISLGAHNDYHHPHKETVALLAERCIPTYRTDRDGNITLVTDGHGWKVTTSKGTLPVAAVPGPGGDDPHPGDFGPRPDPGATHSPSGGTARTPATDASTTNGPVYASRRSKVYHPAGCTHLERIREENRVEYPSAADAEAAGLHAAANCHLTADGKNPPPKESTPPPADDSGDSGKKKPKSHSHRSKKSS